MKIRLKVGGCAGFAGDRYDAALAVAQTLANEDGPRFLVFETLAERTLALSQDPSARAARQRMMLKRLSVVLPLCMASGIKIVGNFGSWTPHETASAIADLCNTLDCAQPKVAVVTGDDLIGKVPVDVLKTLPGDAEHEDFNRLISANAYLGAFPIAEAFDHGADIVVTGRIADPALVLGPMIHTLQLAPNHWDALACGTLAGHLIECGGQVSGGYFADPVTKPVPNLAWIGFPIVDITDDFICHLRKPENTGGCITRQTVIEQLLYEIHDPAAYLTPDVVLDLSQVTVTECGQDKVLVSSPKGLPKPDSLKTTLCFEAGWYGETEISYAGLHADSRGLLAIEVIRERAAMLFPDLPLRCDLVGVSSVFASNVGMAPPDDPEWLGISHDVRVRVATFSDDKAQVAALCADVEALYTNGPAGGGGVRIQLTPRITTGSVMVPASSITTQIAMYCNGKAIEISPVRQEAICHD
ncbi:acyclic terpene utilization AtuA family protein [Neptunomonas phycophila]|uniref:acyclic terpene utilization AtuA family protein n=1 Tax=Neptunomonas phycophila TaxID=1572645 RepID=UPI001BEB7EB4|nr:acyclic terpene utilization AtuA family protein [Neptunomonas phycophila]MBT3145635.1 DUF1446 domain-containing protein [Neptunomonas phycophila]